MSLFSSFSWRTFQAGIMAFLTAIHCCPDGRPLIRANKTKREIMDSYIPVVNSSRSFNKIRKYCSISRNGCRINTTEQNHTILVSFSSEDNVLSDEIKICYIFEFQSNENRAFHFFGTSILSSVYTFFLPNKKVESILQTRGRGILVYDQPLWQASDEKNKTKTKTNKQQQQKHWSQRGCSYTPEIYIIFILNSLVDIQRDAIFRGVCPCA